MTAVTHLDRPAYLGLDRSVTFRRHFEAGVRAYGLHFAGSRAAPYCPGVYLEAETFLAGEIGTEAALLTSSGSLAAKLATEALQATGYHLAAAGAPSEAGSGMHPAWGSVPEGTGAPEGPKAVRRVSVDPITIAVTPAREDAGPLDLDVTDASHDLLLDAGTPLREGWPGRRQLLVCSLGKALSVPAGLIAGPRDLVEAVRALPSFRGASPPPPAYVAAVVNGWDTVTAARRRLADVVATVAAAPGGSTLRDYPVVLVRDGESRARLREAGFVLSAVSYPNADSEAHHRMVLRADLRDETVEFLVRVLRG